MPVALSEGMRSPNVVVLTALAIMAPLPRPAQAGWVSVLSGSPDRVVASDGLVSVVRNGEAWILREDGHLLRRLRRPDVDKEASGKAKLKREAEDILDVLDVAETDRDTDYANEILDNESTLAERRIARLPSMLAEPEPKPPLLTATASDIWIAGSRGVFRFDSDGRMVRAFGHEAGATHLAAAGQSLLVGQGNTLALLSTVDGTRRSRQLPSTVQGVALSASGHRVAWTTLAGASWADDSGAVHALDNRGAVVDLVYCDETLIVLMPEGILAVAPDGQEEMLTYHLQVEKLVCRGGSNAPWVSLGQGLFASADRGHHWESIALPAGSIPLDVAVSAHHVWLATNEGLFSSSDSATGENTMPLATTNGMPRIREERKPSPWTSWMPRVTLQGHAAFAPDGHQWQALAFATFPLDVKPRLAIPVATTAVVDDSAQEPVLSAPRRASHPVNLRDPDRACLTDARRKAVELAMAEPERARSYLTRAGRAAWLPELRVLVARRYGRSESLDLNSSSTALSSPVGIDTVNDIRYEARATWDLARLVFSSEELAAQTQAWHMAELRRDIETTIGRLYFERRRLVVDLGDALANDRVDDRDKGVRGKLRVGEIEAELDAMSAGVFSTCTTDKSTGATGE